MQELDVENEMHSYTLQHVELCEMPLFCSICMPLMSLQAKEKEFSKMLKNANDTQTKKRNENK